MSAPLPPVMIEVLSLPVADATAAGIAVEAMRSQMDRLWQADHAAGLGWGTTLDTLSLDGRVGEPPEVLGLRLAGAIRARLVREPTA